MTDQILDSAIVFATIAHAGQFSKGSNLPYIMHPLDVMAHLRVRLDAPTEMLVAAVLHDVVEDTGVSRETIERRFGPVVATLVDELTDRFTKEAYPEMNRAARKLAERARLAEISADGQTIKVADMISNTVTIVQFMPGFARVYLDEKAKLLDVLTRADPRLLELARAVLNAAEHHLVQLQLAPKGTERVLEAGQKSLANLLEGK